MASPFAALTNQWCQKIARAMEYKQEKFGKDAEEGMRFFNGPYEFLYGLKKKDMSGAFVFTGDDDLPPPTFAMSVNRVAEMVQLFGPVLYYRNPIRQVNPRQLPQIPPQLFGDPSDPMVQMAYQPLFMAQQQQAAVDVARAGLLQSYLNYTPVALDLKAESRRAIDEAIIKGMGLLWTELYTPVGSSARLVGSFYDSVDNLVMDPDMLEVSLAKWVARRRCLPVWEVERRYGLPPGSLRGNAETLNQQGIVAADPLGDYRRRQGLTNDMLVFWEIYSKMGVGARMLGVPPDLQDQVDLFGDFVYLCVCENIDYPLNVGPQLSDFSNPAALAPKLQWPTPFWADDGWPFTPFIFHEIPNCVWPMSHLKPGMGELKFINWVYSFIAGKIRTSCRDFIAVQKSASEEIKQTILRGSDLELIEIDRTHGTIKEVVEFLQHPQFNGDIWKVLQAVEANFEKRVGLTELMYGESEAQMRSASEANLKSSQMSVRPDDMANKVEDAMSDVARKEALAARWHLQPQDVQPMLGQVGAQFWAQLLVPSDPNEILHQLEYRIEAGSVRKPNRERDAANAKDAMTTLFAPLFQFGVQTGQVGPVNALLAFWGKTLDLDTSKFLLQPPPMPPPVGGPGPGGPPQATPPKQGASK